jgi:hypothetical protein
MKRVRGFLTKFGDFYKTKEEAELSEARQELENDDGLVPHIDNGFIEILEEYHDKIIRYLNAYKAAGSAKPEVDNSDYEGTEKDITRILEQPFGSDESMSDLGSGVESAQVRNKRTEYGAGVRGDDASSVRSSSDMAARARARPSKARSRDR